MFSIRIIIIYVTAVLMLPGAHAFDPLDVPAGWQEEGQFTELVPEPVPGPNDKRAGFIPFSRNYMEPIYSSSRPRRGEITSSFEVTLARGEYEPVVVALYAVRDVGDVRLEIKDVRSPARAIPDNWFEVRKLEYRAVLPRGRKKRDKRYVLVPSILRKTNSARLRKGRTSAFWVTVYAGKDALPGNYSGKILITNQGEVLRTLRLKVRILPFVLEEIPDKVFSVLYTPTNLAPALEENARILMRDMRAHGMNSYSPIVSAWGEPLGFDKLGRPKIERLLNHLEWSKEEGFWQPTLLNINKLIRTGRPASDANYKKFEEEIDIPNLQRLVLYLEEERKRNKWPEIIYIPIDEPGCFTDRAGTRREEIAVKVLRTLSRLGVRGATTIADLVDNKHRKLPRWRNVVGWWDKMRPYCKVRIYCNGFPEGETSLANEIRDAKMRGHQVMLYENSSTMGIDPFVSRMYFGFYGWRTGVMGITAWTHPTWNKATVLHAWDDWQAHRQAVRSYFERNWELPPSTVCWEMVREGVDDQKFLYLFEQRLRQKNKPGKKYLELLREIESAVDETRMSAKKPQCNWRGERFSYFRQRIIDGILELE